MPTTFDPVVWTNRAMKRYNRTRHAKPKAIKKLIKDQTAIHGIEKLVAWCKKRRIEVIFERRYGAEYVSVYNKIYIAANYRPSTQLCYLLHECGHYLISCSNVCNEKYKMGYNLPDGADGERSFEHRCAILEEEFEAWRRGGALATRLGIYVNTKEYDKLRATSMKSYMKWALRVDGFGGNYPT